MKSRPNTSGWGLAALHDARAALDAFIAHPENALKLEQVAAVLAGAVKAGGKLLICGNGGSSADAMHFAEELTGRFRKERPPIAAIACTDVGHITCTANDYGYEEVFARWVTALARRGDILIVLSTSGNSRNILRAVEAAKAAGIATVALLGKGGGSLKGRSNHEWIMPGDQADRIQEVHMVVLHALIEGIERELEIGG